MGFNIGGERGGSQFASPREQVARRQKKEYQEALKRNKELKRLKREQEIRALKQNTLKEKKDYLKEKREFEVAKRKEREARNENRLINRLPGLGTLGFKVKKKKRPSGKGRIRLL